MSEKKPSVPIWRFFPNIVTLLGLCSGLTSIKYTFHDNWDVAVIFILVAAVMDGVDGRIARILDSSTDFGAQLDSLADLINFGVAPGLLVYFHSLVHIKVLGWAVVMAFVICMAIRLARFNVENLVDGPSYKKNFFVGVPAPIGALLVLFPVIASFNDMEIDIITAFASNMYFIVIYCIIISIFVVSRIPTFSGKNLHIPSNMESITTFLAGIVIVILITRPWSAIPILLIFYILSIPVSIVLYYHLENKNKDSI